MIGNRKTVQAPFLGHLHHFFGFTHPIRRKTGVAVEINSVIHPSILSESRPFFHRFDLDIGA